MIVPIPTGATYKTTLVGFTFKSIQCEHCGTEFVYLLKRYGAGQSSAAIYENMRHAKVQALTSAENQLSAALRDGAAIVPCPNCGKYQADMMRHAKRRRIISAASLCAIVLVCYGFLWNLCTPPLISPVSVRWGIPGLVTLIILLTVLMIWACLHDMNARADARKGSKPGERMLRSEYEAMLAAAREQMNSSPNL